MKKINSSNPSRIKSSIIVASKFKMSKNKNQSNNFDNSYITIVNNSDTEENKKNEDFLSNAHNNITKILSGFINDFEEDDKENYIKKDTIKNVKKIIEKKSRISFNIENNKNSSNKSLKKIIRKSKKQHTVNDIKDNLNQEKKELKKSLIINNKDFHDFFNLSIDASHENLLKKDNFNSNRNLKSFSKHAKNILKNNIENNNNIENKNNNNENNNKENNNIDNNNNNNDNNNNDNININNNNNNNINNNNVNNNNNKNFIFNNKSSNLLQIQKQRSFNKNRNRFLKSFKKSSSINQINLFSAKKQLKKFSLNEIKKSNTPKKNENRRNTISNVLKNLPKRISKNLDNIFFPENSINSTKKTIDILNINGLTNKNIIELNDIKNKLKNEIIGNESNSKIKNSLIKNKEFFSDKEINKEIFTNKKLIEFRYRKLFIKKLVYDSLDDSEIESEEIETFFIYPFSIYNIILDFLVFLFAIFDLIYTPLNLSYLNNYCKETEFNFDNIYNFIIEILYIIDLIKSFFVAYFNFEEILIQNLNEIIIHYLSDWFILDLCCSIPIQNIFLLTINQCSITNTNDFEVTFVGHNKYIYIFVLLRQIKIFKIFSFNSFMLKFRIFLSKLESSNNYGKIFMSLFIFFIALHYIACIFIFIGKNYYPNWIVKNNLESNNNFLDLYITSIYFMIATLTTVGYGDISTYNIWEKIFGLIMLLIGILGYSYAVSSLSNYIKNIDAKNLEYEKKCEMQTK